MRDNGRLTADEWNGNLMIILRQCNQRHFFLKKRGQMKNVHLHNFMDF